MRFVIVKRSSQLLIVVPKSVSRKAVVRNLIKRRIREAINSLSTVPNVRITALPPIVEKSFQEIKAEVEQAMKLL